MDSQMLDSVQAAGRPGEFVGFFRKEEAMPGIAQFDVVQGFVGYPEEIEAYVMLTFKPRPPKPAVLSHLFTGEGAFGRIFETTRSVAEYQVLVELPSDHQFYDTASMDEYISQLLAAQQRGEGDFLLTDGRRNYLYTRDKLLMIKSKPGTGAWDRNWIDIGFTHLEQGERIFCRP